MKTRDSRNTQRRAFLKGLATLGLSACAPGLLAHSLNPHPRMFASACTNSKGQHLMVLARQGLPNTVDQIKRVALPARAHEVVLHPTKPLACAVARRPGFFLVIVDTVSGSKLAHIEPQPGFHFYGHGVFSADDRFFLSSENHIESGQGYIFVRDCERQFSVVKHFPSYGIGPHQLKWLPDQQTLVVANGGIRTHPERAREKLNLDTMKASLAYIDAKSGALLELACLPKEQHQLSIRHIDVNESGTVFAGMQFQGEAWQAMPLVASHRRGGRIDTHWAPEPVNQAMKQYCGSVCFSRSGRFAAASAPRGNLVTFWDLENKSFIAGVRGRDACGLAKLEEDDFLVSSGNGALYRYQSTSKQLLPINSSKTEGLVWDNHLFTL